MILRRRAATRKPTAIWYVSAISATPRTFDIGWCRFTLPARYRAIPARYFNKYAGITLYNWFAADEWQNSCFHCWERMSWWLQVFRESSLSGDEPMRLLRSQRGTDIECACALVLALRATLTHRVSQSRYRTWYDFWYRHLYALAISLWKYI